KSPHCFRITSKPSVMRFQGRIADNSPSISAPGVRLAIRAPKIMHRPQILSHRTALGGSVMKAAVVPAVSSSWQIKDVPQPQPGPNQVLVKMHASGICYTDVHLTLGHFPGPFSPNLRSRTSGRDRCRGSRRHDAEGGRPRGYRLDSIHLRALRMVPAWSQNELSRHKGNRD